MFLIQKLLSRFFFPVPLTLVVLALGIVMLLCAKNRRRQCATFRIGVALVASSGVFLWLSATPSLADAFLWTLESRYMPQEEIPPEISYIAVLGSGHSEYESFSAWQRLGRSAHARVGEAVRVSRGNGATIIFSGYEGSGQIPAAIVARDAAVELGLDNERTRVLTEPRNTAEEAEAIAEMLEAEGASNVPVALITSASHMHRAVYHAERAGLRVYAIPTDYRAVPGPRSMWGFFPSAGALSNTERAWYEYMGIVWARISGK